MTSKENNHRGFVSSLYGTASPGGAVPVAHNSATATMATKGNELLVLDTQAVTVGNDVESQPGVSSASPKTKEEKKEEMFITKSKDDVVCLDAAATPQAAFKKTFSQRYNLTSCWIWTVVFLLGTALVAFVVIAVKPENKESNSNSQDEDIYDRQGYYEDLLGILESPLMQTNSPQGEAIQWMAFNDVPLPLENSNETISRLWQRFALVTSYFANGGPNLWSAFNRKSTAGWIEFGAGVHECDWMGVECNANMQVTGLSLFGEGNGITLTGLLSTELGILTNLEHLDLSTNRLEGKIPDEWKALTNLISLNLNFNQLTSTVPAWLGKFSGLQALSLGGNSFTGDLSLSGIEKLTGLERFEVQTNSALQGKMHEILTALPKLEYFDVSATTISGHFPNSTAISNLQVLKAVHTPLTGTIPDSIGSWTNLKSIELSQVLMVGTIPTQLGLLTNLNLLYITSAHDMHGTLPTELGLLSNQLTNLDFRWGGREGTLPTEYGSLTNLNTMDFAFNKHLSGTVPSEYARLTNLKHLYLKVNNLVGTIQPHLCDIVFEHFEMDCLTRSDEVDCACCTLCI